MQADDGAAGRRGCRRGSSTSGSTCAAARTCWCRCRPQEVHAEQLEGLWPDLRDKLRDLRDQVGNVRRLDAGPEELRIRIGNPAGMDAALEAAHEVAQAGLLDHRRRRRASSRCRADGDQLVVTLTDAQKTALDQRTHAAEPRDHPPPRRRGGHPRALDPAPGHRPHPGAGAGRRLGRGAAADHRQDRAAVVPRGRQPHHRTPTSSPGSTRRCCRRWTSRASSTSWSKRAVVTGEQLVDSQPSFDQNGRPAVTFRFNPSGGAAFGAVHRARTSASPSPSCSTTR